MQSSPNPRPPVHPREEGVKLCIVKSKDPIKAAVQTALEPFRKGNGPAVLDFHIVKAVDHLGDDALFITVVLKDPRNGKDYRWLDVKPVEEAIRRRVSQRDPSWFTYVNFQLESEGPTLTA